MGMFFLHKQVTLNDRFDSTLVSDTYDLSTAQSHIDYEHSADKDCK